MPLKPEDQIINLKCPLCGKETENRVSVNTTLIHYPMTCKWCLKQYYVTYINQVLHIEPSM